MLRQFLSYFFTLFPVVCKDDEFMCGDEVGKRLVRSLKYPEKGIMIV